MSRATLAVVCDQLRALGLEDVARWVENPDAVRRLVALEPYTAHDDSCTSCGEQPQDSHTHLCRIAAAWRAIGDPRGAADIERAHEEALRTMAGRDLLSGEPAFVTQGAWDPARLATEDAPGYRAFSVEGVHCTEQQHHWASSTRPMSDARGMEAVEAEARATHRYARDHGGINGRGEAIPFLRR